MTEVSGHVGHHSTGPLRVLATVRQNVTHHQMLSTVTFSEHCLFQCADQPPQDSDREAQMSQ